MKRENNAADQTSNGYVINQELVEEMVRLNRQGLFFTESMGGPLVEQKDLSGIHDLLDLACGPGEWVMRVAREYPGKRVVGVDLSERMIEYASVQAEADDLNASFRVMDVTNPLDFPTASFDLINARLLQGFMKRDAWGPLLVECRRLLRPGGIIRLTESEPGFANSPIIDRCAEWWVRAIQQTGQAFSVRGQHYFGITPVMKRLLTSAGYIAPRHVAHAIDYSTGTPAHESMLEDGITTLKLGAPFLIRLGITSQAQIKQAQEQLQALVGKEEFCAYCLLMTVWAHKPA